MKKWSTTLLFCALATFATSAVAYPELPKGIKSGGGALVGDTVYVGLGSAGADFYKLNLKDANAQWEAIAQFPGGDRSQPVVAAVQGKVYVFGGLQKNAKGELQLVNDAHVYDPATNVWTKLPTRSPLGLVGATGATYDNKIYVFGGSNLSIFNGYFQDYTAADDEGKKKVMDAYFNQRTQDYFFNTTLFAYEPATNRWYNEGKLPFSGRAGAAVYIDKGTVTLVNGEVKPGLRTDNWIQGKFKKNGEVDWGKEKDVPGVNGQVQDGYAGAYLGKSHGYLLLTGGANFPGAAQAYKSGKLFAHQGLTKTYHNDVFALKDGKWKLLDTKLPQVAGYGVTVTYGDKVLLIGGETVKGTPLTTVVELSYDGKQLTVK